MFEKELESLQAQWNQAHDAGDMEAANQLAIQMQELRNALGIKNPDTGDIYIN